MIEALDPVSDLERIMYKQNIACKNQRKSFINLKGQQLQLALTVIDPQGTCNSDIAGFSCTHYSVLESKKKVVVTVNKNKN